MYLDEISRKEMEIYYSRRGISIAFLWLCEFLRAWISRIISMRCVGVYATPSCTYSLVILLAFKRERERERERKREKEREETNASRVILWNDNVWVFSAGDFEWFWMITWRTRRYEREGDKVHSPFGETVSERRRTARKVYIEYTSHVAESRRFINATKVERVVHVGRGKWAEDRWVQVRSAPEARMRAKSREREEESARPAGR